MNFPSSFPWVKSRRPIKRSFHRQTSDTSVVLFDKSLRAKRNNFPVLAPQRGEVHPRRSKEIIWSTRAAVDIGLWHQNYFIASGWALDIFVLFSFIHYFLYKYFPTKITPYFTPNTTDLSVVHLCSPFLTLDFSLLIEQHLTPLHLPTAELRAASIIAVSPVINWSHLHHPYKWLCAVSRIQKRWHFTARWDMGLLQQHKGAGLRDVPHAIPSRIGLPTLLSLTKQPKPYRGHLGVG